MNDPTPETVPDEPTVPVRRVTMRELVYGTDADEVDDPTCRTDVRDDEMWIGET